MLFYALPLNFCRAEVAKAQLADNVKGLKKEAGQQLRELQVPHLF